MEIAAVVVAIVCVVIYLNTRKDKQNEVKETNGAQDALLQMVEPDELFKALGVEIKDKYESEDGKQIHYYIVYQGGYFRYTFLKGSRWMDVAFFNFHECRFEHLVKAMTVANHLNENYRGWTCYVDVSNNDAGEKIINANLSYGFAQYGNLEQMKTHLQSVMGVAFTITHDYKDRLNEKIKNQDEVDEVFLNDRAFKNTIARIKNLKELNHLPNRQEEEQPKASLFSIQHVVNLFEDTDFGCLQDMRIICGDNVEKVTDVAQIEAFDLREYIRKRSDAREILSMTLIFGFEHHELFINLTKAEGSSENTLYFTMNFICSGGEVSKDTVTPLRTKVEVRLTNDDQDYWEAKYMVDEAMDKAKEGRMNELTNEQRLVLAHTDPSVQMDLYWGKKYYKHQCYYQSLRHFMQVHTAIKNMNGDLSEEVLKLYAEINFYIGFIYNDMKMYDHAFYYLYIAQSFNRIDAIMEFTNCLCNMRDTGAKNYIHMQAQETSKLMEKDEEEAERLMPLYNFLRRRFAYVLVDHCEFDDAEQMLNEMIENGQDVEFAKGELEYIKRIQESEKEKE